MNAIDLANQIAVTLAKGDAVPGGFTYSVVNGTLKVKLDLADVDVGKLGLLDERTLRAITLDFNSGPMMIRVDLNMLKEVVEKKVHYRVTRECVSCGNLFSDREVTEEVFEKTLKDDPNAEVSVEGDTDYIRYRGICRGCGEDYESSQE